MNSLTIAFAPHESFIAFIVFAHLPARKGGQNAYLLRFLFGSYADNRLQVFGRFFSFLRRVIESRALTDGVCVQSGSEAETYAAMQKKAQLDAEAAKLKLKTTADSQVSHGETCLHYPQTASNGRTQDTLPVRGILMQSRFRNQIAKISLFAMRRLVGEVRDRAGFLKVGCSFVEPIPTRSWKTVRVEGPLHPPVAVFAKLG